MKRLLKDKRGMTLTEIVVALTLLMLVIVGTTPVLLSSYDSLYTAGEYTQDTYEAKSEIEDTLATRNSLNIIENFKVNFENIGEVAQINGKRAVSSLYNSLETIFTGGRAHVAIISSKVINDDKITQTVVLQTTNIGFQTSDEVIANNAHLNTITPTSNKKVDITAMLPDKTTDILSNIYNPGKYRASVKVVSANPETGRIIITISDADFTTSPVKILVTYLDENDKVKTTSCYLTIKTPTIMMAGTTNFGKKYYTTAGVETITADDGTKYTKLQVDGRTMRTDGSSSTVEVPAGTVFKSVNWITEYATGSNSGSNEDVEFVDSSYEPSYYVLTGTNGAIYRTYTFTGVNTVVGKVDLSSVTTDAPYKNSQAGVDVIGLTEKAYVLDDAQATTVYPATWGGDFSHIYGYSAYGEHAGYTNRTDPTRSSLAWYTENVNANGTGVAGYYSNLATFAYYYNGWALSTPYHSMNSRKISYVLTEMPYAMRVGGYMGDVGSVEDYGYDGITFDRIWEQPNAADGTHLNEMSALHFRNTNWIGSFQSEGWYYGAPGSSVARSTIIRSNTNDDGDFDSEELHTLPVYFVNNGSDEGKRKDNGFAQLRLKALTTISPTIIQERAGHKDSSTDMRVAFNTNVNQSEIIVRDAVYIPATSTTSAGVFYVGTVAAYGWITQVDNCGTNDGSPDVQGMQNTDTSNTGWPSFYWIKSDNEGASTTIFKQTIHSDSTDIAWDDYRTALIKNATLSDSTPIKANSSESHNFFVAQPAQGATAGRLFSDVYFTMGFTSNREMVYTNIVYGKNSSGSLIQSLKFCEPLYFQSHYDNADKIPSLYMNYMTDGAGETHSNLNIPDNDYYNVWLPGEMYNLTKVATKDGVTVAVGYAVAGSAYSYLNTVQNASTGLGGIYNDGVLAAMVLGKDSAFTNLLYFKDNENFDSTSLSDGSVKNIGANGTKTYKDLFGADYGTHTRDSVQFTAVDISVQYQASGSTEIASYYAYYADNKGRLFRSLVANKTTYSGASSSPTLVSYIADEAYDGTRSSPAYMERIKFSDGTDFSNYFDKITTIKCSGDYIIVGGYSTTTNNIKWNVAVGIVQNDGSVVFKKVSLDVDYANIYCVEDALILDGYVYFVGINSSNNKGWIYAHSLEDIASKGHNGVITFNVNHFVGDDALPDKLYAIDGHSAS